ncbi:GLPGLI family protein [Moheibacter sediminis]|uniref:GLPGLI family protein n=1 Tax=Moheibacter sediminis TaxID=1434700 RepID=A0A1W1YGQ8_9FLAO|nr:GLPGLI family protein [Moheibacter sediminis]SMC35326.1 GLPGLI family protein [Moheibacter sediminis]
MSLLKVILIFLLYNLAFSLTAQQLEINYTAFVRQTYSEEEKKNWFEDSDLARIQMKTNEEPPAETYIMVVSGKEYSFIYQDRINNSQDQTFDIRYAPAGFGVTYHNLKDSVQMKDIGEIDGQKYYTLDPLPKWDWNITDETKNVLGFQVRKAIAENENSYITAWYALEVPVSSGPAEFFGLPGLILEIEKKSKEREYKVIYIAESIKRINNPKIIKPSKGIQIREIDIEKLWEDAHKKRQEMKSQDIDKE